jgi:hypothetical protein
VAAEVSEVGLLEEEEEEEEEEEVDHRVDYNSHLR